MQDNQNNSEIHKNKTIMTKKIKHYERLSITPIELEVSQCLLAGSNTLQNIEVQEVTVKDFEDDTSFPTGGFEVGFD